LSNHVSSEMTWSRSAK